MNVIHENNHWHQIEAPVWPPFWSFLREIVTEKKKTEKKKEWARELYLDHNTPAIFWMQCSGVQVQTILCTFLCFDRMENKLKRITFG